MINRCHYSKGRTHRYYQLRHVVRTKRIHLVVDFSVDDRERDLVYRDGGKTEVKHEVNDEYQPKSFPVLHSFRVELYV